MKGDASKIERAKALNSNRRVADDSGESGFDASRVLVRADTEDAAKTPLVNRFWVEAVGAPLVKADFLLLIGAGDEKQVRDQLQRLSASDNRPQHAR